MGCFNIMGFHSKLPIFGGDKIVYFFFLKEKKYREDSFPLYTGSLVPLSFPFIGEYNEYGGIENIEESESLTIFRQKFGCEVKDLADAIHTYGGETLKDLNKFEPNKWDKKAYETYRHVLEVIKEKHHWNENVEDSEITWPDGDTLALYFGVERYEVYEKMANMRDTYSSKFDEVFDKFLGLFEENISVDANIFNEHEACNHYHHEITNFCNRIKEAVNEDEREKIRKLFSNFKKKMSWQDNTTAFASYANLIDCDASVLALYDSMKFQPLRLKGEAKKFFSFHRMLGHLCGRYMVSQYGNQSINDMKYQFLELNELYINIINKMKTDKELLEEEV